MKKLLDIGYYLYMLGLLGLFIFMIVGVTSCDCGCTIEDSSIPYEELSAAGKVLVGKHYLSPIPGSGEIVEMDEGSLRMFIEFKGQSIIHMFHNTEVIFEETDDAPHVKFEWESDNREDLTIAKYINWNVTQVFLCTPPGFFDQKPDAEKKNPFTEGLQKGMNGEQTDEYVKSLIDGTNEYSE